MTAACLFNIQKFSLHDGPGIRTTVFFKGCPLRCAWCANPESIRMGRQVLWNRDRCTRCRACAAACPRDAIHAGPEGIAVIQRKCIGCGACAAACPEAALSLSGREYTLDEVVAECLSDRDFYEESGGGVTLSGGEATAQAAFAAALLARLRALGVHTAVETNGFAATEAFRSVAGAADMLLFDVKHHDPARHRAGTGVDNAPILENLAWSVASGKELLVRIPVIRDYSDGPGDAVAFARLLVGLRVDRVQLLPFHQLGQKKYDMLGMPYELGGLAQLHKEDLENYRNAMLAEGMREVIV